MKCNKHNISKTEKNEEQEGICCHRSVYNKGN